MNDMFENNDAFQERDFFDINNVDDIEDIKNLFKTSSIIEDDDADIIIDRLSSSGIDSDILTLKDFELDGIEDDSDDVVDDDIDDISQSMADDAMRLYLRDVYTIYGNKPLLTKDEELKLAKRISEGDNEAKQELIASNLRLVIKYIKRFYQKGIAPEDLLQEGNLGLCIAAEKFDYSKGFRFSTYATWWILQRIRKLIVSRNNIISAPTHVYYKQRALFKEREQFKIKNGREPTDEELSEITGFSLKTIHTLSKLSIKTVDIDARVDGEDSHQFSEIISDPNEKSVEEIVADRTIQEAISERLGQLKERERQVIVEYYLNNKSLQQIGEEMGRTRERVRQIKEDALKKLSKDKTLLSILNSL